MLGAPVELTLSVHEFQDENARNVRRDCGAGAVTVVRLGGVREQQDANWSFRGAHIVSDAGTKLCLRTNA